MVRSRLLSRSLVVAACLGLSISAASAQDVIRFGAPLPLTGPLAPEAIKQQQGYDLWAEQANKAGGIAVGGKKYKVEIVYADYQSNTPRAVQTTEQMITQNNVNFLFSPFGSGAAKAASSVSEKYKIPTIAATASSSQVYDQGYKYLFGTFTPNDTLTTPLTKIVTAKAPDVKKVAILARNDLFPLAIAQEMEKSAKAAGLEVAYFEKYAIGTLDHSATLSQIKSLAPQWIFVTGYINDLLLVRKQMADQQIKAPVVSMIAGPAYQEFIDAAGASAENVTSAAWWHPAAQYDGKDIFGTSANYVKLFRDKYKSTPDYAQASASVAGALFQMAIEKAGSLDKDKVRDALAKLDVVTFFGPVKFGPNGQIDSLEPPVFQIQNAKPVVLSPQVIKQGDFKLGVN
ncbi:MULTISPECIES: amino acid ABC transporter substrate-binding protein [Rhodopseudomonas]|uniref:ABC transporter substrate-binding protein n=1 Tax=Rhodopseudomonas palustris TaxID=1076 RepID=A0A0D7EXA3_RHOPL|nr:MULTISPECIES: amino acid ABC transporter substrate-binding protein [Rhodopseudomonas]KIZ44077.1 ABC transporter substrate-binding protein [Rhodopseudomonas palustris]MDF3812411.1 amino acid ABC transporter substrate-binding protein [Rhodopseudomonas sp. BAL398]WOK17258.1 amino acid ABC transporter substrate-binding protein [Rhodopseudomonas sp. BAL398]